MHEIIKFGSRADVTTLPPPRFRYLLSLLFLRGGPPPLHSRKRLRSGGSMHGIPLIESHFDLPDKLKFTVSLCRGVL